MLIRRETLKLGKLAPKDEVRYGMNGVRIEPDGSGVVTNGCYLVKWTPREAPDASDYPTIKGAETFKANGAVELQAFTIAGESALAIEKSIPKHQSIPILEHAALDVEATNAGDAAVFGTTDLETGRVERVMKNGADYLQYQKVIPKAGRAGEIVVGFDAAYLEAICKTARELSGRRKTYITLRVVDKESPARIESDGDGGEMLAVLMPVRMD